MRYHMTTKQFDSSVSRAVDKGLTILGDEKVKQAFYYHVEKRAHLKRDEIPSDLDAFHKALNDMFFEGAAILEKRMARELYDMLGLEFEANERWSLPDYAKHAKDCTIE